MNKQIGRVRKRLRELDSNMLYDISKTVEFKRSIGTVKMIISIRVNGKTLCMLSDSQTSDSFYKRFNDDELFNNYLDRFEYLFDQQLDTVLMETRDLSGVLNGDYFDESDLGY